jgi:hypothetical protein
MIDARDPAFRTVTSHPRLGPPMLTEHGVVFLDDLRITFDRYAAFDARNPEFARTPAQPHLQSRHPHRHPKSGACSI